jgi:hypothetical protein
MCAYAPTVNDNSGQIMAQGIQNFGQQLAQGLQDYQKNKIHNQALQGENEGIINALAQTPELAKYLPQESQKLLDKKLKAGGLSLADSAKLNGYLTAGVKTYQMGQQMQLQQAQIAETMAQARQREAQAAQMASAPGELAAAMGGGMGGMPAPQQAPMQPAVQGNTVAPAPAGTFRYAPQAQAPQTPPVSALEAMQRYMSGGGRNPQVVEQLNRLATQEREAQAQAAKLSEVRYEKRREGTDEVTIDARTGKEVARGKVNSPTMAPEDQIRVAAETHRINSQNDAAVKTLGDLSQDTERARVEMADIDRMRALISKHGAKTEWGDELKAEISNAWSSITGQPTKVASQQEFFALLQRQIVNSSKSIKGEGSVTGVEREMTGKQAARAGISTEANLALLDNVWKLHERTVALKKLDNDLRKQGKTPAERSAALEDARDSMPIFWGKKEAPDAPDTPKPMTAADLEKEFLSQKK